MPIEILDISEPKLAKEKDWVVAEDGTIRRALTTYIEDKIPVATRILVGPNSIKLVTSKNVVGIAVPDAARFFAWHMHSDIDAIAYGNIRLNQGKSKWFTFIGRVRVETQLELTEDELIASGLNPIGWQRVK